MEVWFIWTKSWIGKEISRQLANRELLIPEELDIVDLILQKQFDESSSPEKNYTIHENKNLDWIVLCTDFWRVNDFAIHFRENLMGIVSMINIDNIQPLNLWIVYTWEKSEVQEIIDVLKINIDEILWNNSKIWIELLNPIELKSKKIAICWHWNIIASDLIHSIEARRVDIWKDFSLQKNAKDWQTKQHISARWNIKASNSFYSKPNNARR